jgi:hypothetical protein
MFITTKSSLLHMRVFYHMRVLAPFVECFLRHLVEHIDYKLAIANGRSCALLGVFVHALYTAAATMIGENGLFCIQCHV